MDRGHAFRGACCARCSPFGAICNTMYIFLVVAEEGGASVLKRTGCSHEANPVRVRVRIVRLVSSVERSEWRWEKGRGV